MANAYSTYLASLNAITPSLVNYASFSADPSEATGALLRAQYADYTHRYLGSENALMGMTTYENPDLVRKTIDSATGANGYVTNALKTADATEQYGFQKAGIQQTAESLADNESRGSINKSTAVVDAANKIRQRLAERNLAIATGVTPNAGRAYSLASE